jgi:hypothetical protein
LSRALLYTVTCLDDEGTRLYAFPVPKATFTLHAANEYLKGVLPERDPRVESIEYPHGSTVIFVDCTATVPAEEMGETLVMVEGVVTDLPIYAKGTIYVPVLSPRKGRGHSVVHIRDENVIAVERAEIHDMEEGVFYE